MSSERCILHLDVDSFYVACERHRRPDLRGRPVAVTQQNSGGFVAISNEARAAGIRKGDGIGAGGHASLPYFKDRPDALMSAVRRKCPDLVVLPMDTEWYRACSRRIRDRLAAWNFGGDAAGAVHAVVEQTSIDDYYLDITRAVAARLAGGCGLWDDDDTAALGDAAPETEVVSIYTHAGGGGGACDHELLLRSPPPRTAGGTPLRGYWRAAAAVGDDARACVRGGFPGITCSVGIGPNRLLSRLVSKRPGAADVTTVLLPEATTGLLDVVPFAKVPGMKGKLGKAVAARTGAVTLGDLTRCGLQDLVAAAGEKQGRYLHAAARGSDTTPVTPNAPPKSLLVESSFSGVAAAGALRAHAAPLAAKLLARGTAHAREHTQRPARFIVTIRRGYGGLTSKRTPIPAAVAAVLAAGSPAPDTAAAAAEFLADAAVATATAICDGTLSPITRLALSFAYDAAPPAGLNRAAAAARAGPKPAVPTLRRFLAPPKPTGERGDAIVIE